MRFRLFARSELLLALGLSIATPALAQFPRSIIDPAAAERGKTLYEQQCARCHGDDVRGTQTAPDLIRSLRVLHDRRENLKGKELAPYLKDAPHKLELDAKQAADLSNFLSLSVNKILRSGYDAEPKNLLSGDAKAGEAYFNGAGGCNKCHSPSGDLAGISKRLSVASLQQRFLFPNTGFGSKRKTQVEVVIGGKTITGDLVHIDDFTVSLKDKDGRVQSFNRIAGVKVKTIDPYAGHVELLNRYTDADIHNLTAYLVTIP
ncbi:c-type cytochrome [Terriglobus albidus]|uniref:c-type cytochrome n=1 Tax=Terriglobus albidus TaxID=1592106 RepID=UPI0021E0E8BB|nr:cytochrome c [Terriglobus albidus]